MDKININGNELTLKPGMKAIVVFEKLTDKPFEVRSTTDVVAYIYASIIAGTPGTRLGFDELLDAFDDAPSLLKQCTDIVLNRSAAEKLVQLSHENEGGTEPKKD